jgi:hypothetical protein
MSASLVGAQSNNLPLPPLRLDEEEVVEEDEGNRTSNSDPYRNDHFIQADK